MVKKVSQQSPADMYFLTPSAPWLPLSVSQGSVLCPDFLLQTGLSAAPETRTEQAAEQTARSYSLFRMKQGKQSRVPCTCFHLCSTGF